jgi:hypothetical protein
MAAYLGPRRSWITAMTNREHHFVCNGPEDQRHTTESVVIMASLGTAPTPPVCKQCGKEMGKVFGSPTISYNRPWRISMGR